MTNAIIWLLCFNLAFVLAQTSLDKIEDPTGTEEIPYLTTKLAVNISGMRFESISEWKEYLTKSFKGFCGLGYSAMINTRYWQGYRGDVKISEPEFFEAVGFIEQSEAAKKYQSETKLFGRISPVLIIGGVLVSGFSSNWGRGDPNILTPTGIGVSVTGIVAGLEAINRSSQNKYTASVAIIVADGYNRQHELESGKLEGKLRTLESISDSIKNADSSEVVTAPYHEVDVKPEPIEIPSPSLSKHGDPVGGKVVVDILVDVDGSVAEVKIVQSSGKQWLDNAVLESAKTAKFTPAKHQGRPVRVWVKMPYTFKVP